MLVPLSDSVQTKGLHRREAAAVPVIGSEQSAFTGPHERVTIRCTMYTFLYVFAFCIPHIAECFPLCRLCFCCIASSAITFAKADSLTNTAQHVNKLLFPCFRSIVRIAFMPRYTLARLLRYRCFCSFLIQQMGPQLDSSCASDAQDEWGVCFGVTNVQHFSIVSAIYRCLPCSLC